MKSIHASVLPQYHTLIVLKPPHITATYALRGHMMCASYPLKVLYVWCEWITVFKLAVFIDSGDMYAENIVPLIFFSPF